MTADRTVNIQRHLDESMGSEVAWAISLLEWFSNIEDCLKKCFFFKLIKFSDVYLRVVYCNKIAFHVNKKQKNDLETYKVREYVQLYSNENVNVFDLQFILPFPVRKCYSIKYKHSVVLSA